MTTTQVTSVHLLCIVVLSSLVGACATTSRGVVRSAHSTYGETFKAALAAANEAGFAVVSSDMQTGSIAAVQRTNPPRGNATHMKILVHRMPSGVKVVVTVAQPPGARAAGERPCKCRVKSFVYALENRLPAAEVQSIQ